MSHPAFEVLLAVEEATEWSAADVTAHIASCDECQAIILELEAVGSLRATLPPDAGFEARVARSLANARAATTEVEVKATPARQRKPDWLTVGIFACASINAWLLLLYSSWTSGAAPSRPIPMGSSTAFALLTGFGVAWYTARKSTDVGLGRSR
jgi:anti-sigma factor ChrR (cupin superfamily)